MDERRHAVERVGQRAETRANRQHPFGIARARVAGRTDDAVFQEDAHRVGGAVDFRGHRHQQARAFARVHHLVGARRAIAGSEPLGAMHAAELRIEKRTFEVDAQTSRAARLVLFEIVCGVDDLGCHVQHRFEWRRHHAGDKSGRAHARILGRRDRHGIALVAIEEHVGGAVGVDVDQSGCDAAARGKRVIRRTVGGQNRGDASVFDGDPSDRSTFRRRWREAPDLASWS